MTLPGWLTLEPGEGVLFDELPDRRARFASYVATLGLFELWRRRTRFIVTDLRLITFRGVLSRDQQVIPLHRIDRVSIQAQGPSATVVVATVGGALGTQPFGPMGTSQARRLVVTLERARGSHMG